MIDPQGQNTMLIMENVKLQMIVQLWGIVA